MEESYHKVICSFIFAYLCTYTCVYCTHMKLHMTYVVYVPNKYMYLVRILERNDTFKQMN